MIKRVILAFSFLLIHRAALYAADKEITLPKPGMHKDVTIEEAFDRSRTDRFYSEKPLTLAELSAVLWAAAGKRYDTVTGASRTYPSAYGRYPIAFYIVIGAVEGMEAGIYQYLWDKHALISMKLGDCRRELVKKFSAAYFAAQAPATVVLAVVFKDWFGERGNNLYVPLDAGHASQNIRLEAAALDLAVGIAGEFDGIAVKEFLEIEEVPVLFLTLGHR
jgi:SagB-type dehydrogenase family enzyme